MSKYVTQLINTSEAKSPVISGLTQSVSLIADVLNMQTATMEDYEMTEIYISDTDRYRLYQVGLSRKGWLDSPDVVIKKNNVEMNIATDSISVDYLGGSIEFLGTRPVDGDVITVSATYITGYSTVLQNLSSNQSDLISKAAFYVGGYTSLSDLENAVSSPALGYFGVVSGTTENNIYVWNTSLSDWEPVFTATDLTAYSTTAQTATLLAAKEDTISAHGTTSASDDYYYSGRKTWIDLIDKVRTSVLTGLSTSSTSTVTATDTVLSAIGKLQGQVTSNNATLTSAVTDLDSAKAETTALATTNTNVSNIIDGTTVVANTIQTYAHSYTSSTHYLTGSGANGKFKAIEDGTITTAQVGTTGDYTTCTIVSGDDTELEIVSGRWYQFILDGETLNFSAASGLKLKVVGGAQQPENPIENTIWLPTEITLSGKYQVSTSKPTTREDSSNLQIGDVWVAQCYGIGVVIRLSKMLSVEIAEASVYDGEDWIRVDAEVYDGSEWQQCLNLLYYNGFSSVETTNMPYNTNTLLRDGNSSTFNCIIGTFDASKYSTLYVKYQNLRGSNMDTTSIRIGVATTADSWVRSITGSSTTDELTTAVDISDVTDEVVNARVYVYFAYDGSTRGAGFGTITAMWLER